MIKNLNFKPNPVHCILHTEVQSWHLTVHLIILKISNSYSVIVEIIARTHGCVRNDSETHETVLLDCTTGEAGSACNPVTSVKCVSLSFRTHPCVLAFITYIFCKTELRWLLANEFHKKVTRSYIFFKFAICSIALLSLDETCHLKGSDMVTVRRTLLLLSCYDCDSTRQHYDVTRFKYVLWRRTMHERVMNIHYQTWIAKGDS